MRITALAFLVATLLAAAALAQDDVGYSASGEMVSFDASTLPAADAFERLARSMGSSYISNESVKGNVTLDFQNVYYTEAFQRAADRAKVKIARIGNLFVIGNPMRSSEVDLHGTVPPPDPNLEADLAAEGENRDYLTFSTGPDGMSLPAFIQFIARSAGVKVECDPALTHRLVAVLRAVHWRNLVDAAVTLCDLDVKEEGGVIRLARKR